jgi:hypothetical protein
MSEADVVHTPDQRLRVFVSSTLEELAAERRAVRDAVTRLRLVPVMFELGARPHPPREAVLLSERFTLTRPAGSETPGDAVPTAGEPRRAA